MSKTMTSTRVILILHGTSDEVRLHPNRHHAVADCFCPDCGEELVVIGTGRSIGGHNFYRAAAACVECKSSVGEIRAYVSTPFGTAEDTLALYARARVA